MLEILKYIKKHGERLDTQIAEATGVPLETVREHVASLAAAGNVVTCNITRFQDGKPIEAWMCRMSGYIPPPAPGRKAKVS